MQHFEVEYTVKVRRAARIHCASEEDAWKLMGNVDFEQDLYVEAVEVLEVAPE
jgi:hypothetical protein